MTRGMWLVSIVILIVLSSVAIAPYWFGTSTGLVLHMTCDGDFTDRSGEANHGTQSGGVSIGAGVKGRGCVFDGSDDNINAGADRSLEINISDWTITAWIKFGGSVSQNIVEKGGRSNTNKGYNFWYFTDDDDLRFYVGNGTTRVTGDSDDNLNLNDNNWHFVAVTVDRSGNIEFYKDATSVGTTDISTFDGQDISNSINTLNIGKWSNDNFPFNGTIDEIRIYNKSLTSAEILALYDANRSYKLEWLADSSLGISNSTPAPIMFNETPEPTISDESGLVGYWKFNTNALDSSGEANNGTLVGVSNDSGRWNEAYSFGGSADYVDIENNVSLYLNETFTASAWVYPRVYNAATDSWAYGIYNNLYYSQDEGWMMWLTGTTGTLKVFLGNTQYNSGTTIPINKWSHISTTKNKTHIRMYVNGELVYNNSAVTKPYVTTFPNIFIGKESAFFNGKIDEVRVYNRTLSASEIKELYLTKGLVGHWSMDSSDGSSNSYAIDKSGYEKNGTVNSATLITSGRWNDGYWFDGTGGSGNDNYITLGSSNYFGQFANNFTFSAWFKYYDTAVSVYQRIYDLNNHNLFLDTSIGGLNGQYPSNTQQLGGNGIVIQGTWYHIVVAINRINSTTSNITAYLNGEFIDTDSSIGNITPTSNDLKIGDAISIDRPFNGTIDEIKFFNKALTASEAKELYLSRGLVGHWSFDSRDGSNSLIAPDISGYNNSGTVTSAVFTNEGRFKEGYSFDTDNYILIPTEPSLSVRDNFTINFWVKPIKKTDTTNDYIIHKSKYRVAMQSSNIISLYIIGDGAAWHQSSTNVITDGAWNHVAITFNSTNTSFYINGALDKTVTTTTGIANDSSVNALLIGSDGSSGLNGSIDEVKIYNRILTATEISKLYSGEKTHKVELISDASLGIVNETPTPTLSDETGLVGWWKMNGNAFDSSGEGNHGTLQNVNATNGRWGEGYQFFSNTSCMNISYSTSMNSQNLTVSAWINLLGVSGLYGDFIFAKEDTGNSNNRAYHIELQNDGDLVWSIDNGTATNSNVFSNYDTAYAGSWHHVAGTANGTTLELYIDGVSVDSDPRTVGYIGFDNELAKIGCYRTPTYPSVFNGTIDEVRLYNRTLSPSEVKELYQSKGLVGHWSFDTADGSSSSFAMDKSGYENNGTVTSATFTNEGRFKEGYTFDGIDDYIKSDIALNFNSWDAMSLGLWFKADSINISSADVLYAHSSNVVTYSQILTLNTNQKLYGIFYNSSSLSVSLEGNTVINPGQWYHAAFVANGTHIIFYLNGQNDGNSPFVTFFDDARNIVLGSITQASFTDFNGTIDEVKLFRRALTPSEVLNLYQGSKTHEFEWWSVVG